MKKWYSLIDKVYRLDNLERAYRAVRANKGAPGVDGETVEAFGQNLEERLRQLHHELKTGTYEPQPVLRVEIPKADGSKRPLGIPTVKDRVVVSQDKPPGISLIKLPELFPVTTTN
ncbi:hypothetical protein PTH_2250 [Pelotomaculum thermopropionicum SI]|uniref:Retron-type reverse transcriptase n=1 Tax=Pelotomaculum thermopropionicum (strain DSM 13744 / JCM 10971 / SI) TaxID=370438 RepID=A5D007_PELTS|nr:hypothetical protein PTH_2250 [Pelotomaculum thermopropionicum SI]